MTQDTSVAFKVGMLVRKHWLGILASGMAIYISFGFVSDLAMKTPNESDIANYLNSAAKESCRVEPNDIKDLQCGTDKMLINSQHSYIFTCTFRVPRRGLYSAVLADNNGEWRFEPEPYASNGDINANC